MAEIVRRRSFGAVLPLGRHISISGSRPIQCASDSIALSSFQEKQNARHYKQFKFELALARVAVDAGLARGNMYGGFSLTLSRKKHRPAVQINHLSSRAALIRFA